MKILIKGGVWKNTEDEILKAAVMKYGKNQWARISSLLVRKTAKQCKARWFEWLDPDIKKIEWAQNEDEKLLHLAKLMPTQWRTIAPIVGRTPAQCLERYQKLLDEAELDDEDDDGMTGEDVRKLRPGEIDPDPETKPARPDPVDMDEDEKEMLSEARARLANTQGKKAKRKAREKQLEEARRLAGLQKRRELKAAGIETKLFRKINKRITVLDYNSDIPFHAKAPEGFWNTLDEKEKEDKLRPNLDNVLLSKLEGKLRGTQEAELRKEDIKKQKKKKEGGNYVTSQALKTAKDAENLVSQRKKLFLPAPQVSESELQQIIKIGYIGEQTNQISGESSLQTDYQHFSQPALRTPRLQDTSSESLKTQAKNLHQMTNAQTPLLGGDLDIQGEISFNGATPRKMVASTPNPMMTTGGVTPGGAGVALTGRTPLRDEFGINSGARGTGGGGFDETPLSQKKGVRQHLSSLFKKLPKPANDFEILVPEEDEDKMDIDDLGGRFTEDESDVQKRKRERDNEERTLRMAKRSSAVKLDLPRPLLIRNGSFALDGLDTVGKMIREEMAKLIKFDSIAFTYPGQQPALDDGGYVDDVSIEEFERAGIEICNQVEKISKMSQVEFDQSFKSEVEKFTFIPGDGESLGEYRQTAKLSPDELIILHQTQLSKNRELMKIESQKALKLEKKLSKILGGYQIVSKKLNLQHKEKFAEFKEISEELVGMKFLKETIEDVAVEERLVKMQKEVDELSRIEIELQSEYKRVLELMEEEKRSERGLVEKYTMILRSK